MSELQIDGRVAGYMCDVVESLTRLEALLVGVRWHMYRGEPLEMAMALFGTKKHFRELKGHLEMLEHVL